VTRAAVCGTDSAEWDHGPVLARPPVILGHEFTGEVIDVGSTVKQFQVGDRVVSGAGVSCGTCDWCLTGRTNLCSSYHTLGLHVDGGLAEYVNAPASTLLPVPDDVSDDEAALAQPQSVAMHAVRRSGVLPGDTCVVIGAGGIGAFIIAAARARGVEDLIALDIDPERLKTASKLGASKTIDVSGTDLVEAIRAAAGSDGPHVVIEATGAAHAPAAAFKAVRRGGRVLLVGLQGAPREVDLLSLTVREIDVVTTLAHVFAEDLADSLEVLRTTDVFETVVDKVIGLDELVDEAIRPLAERRARGKIIVDVTR
jgi:threonine dehydrogenase-like Zn-dependent dehydrogenase